MKLTKTAVGVCLAGAVFATIGIVNPTTATADSVEPDVEKLSFTEVSEDGLDEDGATDAAADADASNISYLPNLLRQQSPAAPAATSVSAAAGTTVSLGPGAEDSPAPEDEESPAPEDEGSQEETPAPEDEESTTPPDISGDAAQRTEDGQHIAAISDVLELPGDTVHVIGASWNGDAAVTIEIRVKEGDSWGAWEEVDKDSLAEEGKASEPGTEPYLVDDQAQSAQLRVLGEAAPDGAELFVIDPKRTAGDVSQVEQNQPVEAPEAGTEDASVDAGTETGADALNVSMPLSQTAEVQTAEGQGAYEASNVSVKKVPAPKYGSRKSWGAREGIRKGKPSYASSVRAAVVHHTAGSNKYTAEQVPGVIRGIYTFHVQGRGWSDIGYNMIADKFGRLWEGRAGGMTRPVIGAHVANYNSGTFGISTLGTYGSSAPPKASIQAVEHAIAWKLSLHGVSATSKATVNGKRINAVSGHRDIGQTSCPGAAYYAKLPEMRKAIAKMQSTGKAAGEAPKEEKPKEEAKKTPIETYAASAAGKSLGKGKGKEYDVPGGRAKDFEKGRVYWSKATGAFRTDGAIGTLHQKQIKALGLPVGDPKGGLPKGGAYQKFQKGSIHWTSKTGAKSTTGIIQKYWKDKGYERGHLGYPTSDLKVSKGRAEQTFEGARLVWAEGYGTTEFSATGSMSGGVKDRGGDSTAADKKAEAEKKKAEEAKKKAEAEKKKAEEAKKKAEAEKNAAAKKKAEAEKKKAEEAEKKAEAEKKKAEEAKKKAAADKAKSEAQKRKDIVATAKKHVGVPYRWGGTTTAGWDCSGYVQHVYRQHGVTLPRTTSQQRNAGRVIKESEAKPGDLIWAPGHIGIVSDRAGYMYDAGSTRTGTSHRSYSWMKQRGAVFIRVL